MQRMWNMPESARSAQRAEERQGRSERAMQREARLQEEQAAMAAAVQRGQILAAQAHMANANALAAFNSQVERLVGAVMGIKLNVENIKLPPIDTNSNIGF